MCDLVGATSEEKENTTILWDLTNPDHPTQRATLPGRTGDAYAVALTADGRTALTASDSNTAIL
jgi:hypothetical protein